MSEHTSCNVSSCQTCADDAVETLRAELAQSQAREAVLAEALRDLYNVTNPIIVTSTEAREAAFRKAKAALADISPAAKALLWG